MAKCPNCDVAVKWDDAKCAACGAIFAGDASWRPTPETAEELAQIKGLYPTFTMRAREPFVLPFAKRWPVLAGAILGVMLRLAFFGRPGGPYAAMMASFIYLAPVLVGATTVYLAERQRRRSFDYYIWASFMANVFFVLGTFIIMLEGLICAIVIVPMFAVIGMFGGIAMGIVCRITKWPRHALYGFAVLPLVLGGVEGSVETPSRFGRIERTVVIRSAPETVWRQIMGAREIRPEEMRHAWIFRIGVPLPLAGVVEPSVEGPVRRITMGKSVHFDQVFADSRENHYVRWTYRLYPDSFPPHALDDHVLVGGYYFDIQDTAYTLTPAGADTQLKVSMGYRVTTQFNWYADIWARFLLGNFEEVVLDFYRHRSERQ